jgi:predicted nucleic-acid-binding protein
MGGVAPTNLRILIRASSEPSEVSKKRVGLDTSVVLRLLVGEPQKQAALALDFVRRQASVGQSCHVCSLVIAEAYYALHSHYGVPKKDAIQSLLALCKSAYIEAPVSVLTALDVTSISSSKPGFVDRLIHQSYLLDSINLVTFEKASSKLADTVVLS